jgi:protein ImuA
MASEVKAIHEAIEKAVSLKDQVLVRDIEALRAKIGAIEKSGRLGGGGVSTSTPLALTSDLDAILPDGGLTRGALHEVVGPPGAQGAAAGFAAALMGLAAKDISDSGGGVVLWCRRHYDGQENGELYGPGLAAFGLGPERLLEVRAGRDHDILWALEEGLQSTALCAVLGEVSDLSFTASRRLQLAAEARGIPALVLRHNSQSHAVSAAQTRWKVTPATNTTAGYDMRWKLNLLRCRGTTADSQLEDWQVEWRDGRLHDSRNRIRTAPRGFAVAAQAGQRSRYPTEPGLAV